jgi:hypothetical protein
MDLKRNISGYSQIEIPKQNKEDIFMYIQNDMNKQRKKVDLNPTVHKFNSIQNYK